MSEEETSVELRDYQIELFDEIEKRRSCILFLPAGSGKTHIAFWLIKSMVADLRKPFDHGGKRAYFLVNNAQLVHQQGNFLAKIGSFDVLSLTSEHGIDHYSATVWNNLQRKWQVFVMTTQIYLDAVRHSFIMLENTNLLIFDECHHATKSHPMSQVMKLVYKCVDEKKPKILGLSATLLNASIKNKKKFDKKLMELESIFDGKIITSKKCREIKDRYSAEPIEDFENFPANFVPEDTSLTLSRMCEASQKLLKDMKLKHNIPIDLKKNEIQLFKPGVKRFKLMNTTLEDIRAHVTQYGLYVGNICCQYYIIQLYRYLFMSDEPCYINALLYTSNMAQMMRKVLTTSIQNRGGDDLLSIETIMKTSSPKVNNLLDRLRDIRSNDRCIIFVERKMTAKSLFKTVKIFASKLPELCISVDFVIGTEGNPLRNSRETFYDRKKQRDILKNFKSGKTNVLIATNILEEGIDIQACNIVIMLDEIRSFRAYIQSKGRARMKDAKYVILSDELKDLNSRISHYKEIDEWLNELINEKDISKNEDNVSVQTDPDTYTTSAGATINSVGAVPKVYQYCVTLPRDLFTDLIPYWFYDMKMKRCSVQLPSNSSIRTRIEGPPKSTWKEARQAAALEVVKKLHQSKQLDDHLLPVRIPEEVLDKDYWFPSWESDANQKQTTASKEENISDNLFICKMRIPKFLKDSLPLPGIDCYLHYIRTKTLYETPEIKRRAVFHTLMQSEEYNFGIITREKLPPICDFLTHTDLGEVKISMETNTQTLTLNEKQLNDISKFHRTIFLKILRVVGGCFVYDKENRSDGYFVVPLTLNRHAGAMYELSWKCVEMALEMDVKKPSEREIRSRESEDYFKTAVTPWYDLSNSRYIVYDVSERNLNSHLSSSFKKKEYETYKDYFLKKYGLNPLRPEQAMLQVRRITAHLDNLRPIPHTASRKRKRNEEDDEGLVELPPEYCHVYSLPSVFWYKSITLPSVSHRLYYLLMAEELRQKICTEAKVGSLQISKDESTLEHFKEPVLNTSQSSKKIKLLGRVGFKKKSENKTENEFQGKDIYREFDVTVTDIKEFAKFFGRPLVHEPEFRNAPVGKEFASSIPKVLWDQLPQQITVEFVACPKLLTLKKYRDENSGPHSYQILEAITLKTVGDVFHLERLETLGDSLLKYVVSVFTYSKCGGLNEGHLTFLKGQLVSNENLFYCGKKLDIPSFVKAVNFSAKNFWRPPGFSIPDTLTREFIENSLSSILDAKIPYCDQFSGEISDSIVHDLKNNPDDKKAVENNSDVKKTSKEDDNNRKKRINFYLGRQTMKRKDVSDVLEALIGLYVKTCGIEGALKLLKYFGVLRDGNFEELLRETPFSGQSCTEEEMLNLFPQYQSIEKLCNYEFKNKLYLLQAFTHPSYTRNIMTDCYQKLEFIGDAILDFLITSYIYEYCGELSPGQLTDLRSSLVNNNTFGAMAVRLQLHKHLFSHNQRLSEAIESFVTYQQSKGFEIHGNELMKLISEDDTTVAEEVDVPKALGDIFESLAGAIFLDSGCNLSTVWHLYYNFMKHEIYKFSQNIPINPVRAVYESVPGKIQFSSLNKWKMVKDFGRIKEKTRVCLKITVNKENREYVGRGNNMKTAKRAAAKFALLDLNFNEFVI